MKISYAKNPSKCFSILIICLLGFIIYSNTFYYPFHFDDELSITDNFAIKDIRNLKAIWSFCPTRFITYLSFALDYHFHKLNVFGYHLINILIHLTVSVLVWWFIRQLFLTPILKREKISEYGGLIALGGGLIFVTHPIQTQAVTYIVQRTTSLAALFYLLSLNLYVKARLSKEIKPLVSNWKVYYLFSLVSALLGIFTKEIVYTLPFMILLYEFCFLRTEKQTNYKYVIPFFVVLILMVAMIYFGKIINFKEIGRISEEPVYISPLNYLLTQLRVLVTYLRLLFIPLKQNLDYDYLISQTLWELPTLASLGLLVVIFAIGIKFFAKYRLLSFAIFWFFLALSVESSVIPIRDVIFEHRLYLPLVGFSVFLGSIFYYLFKPKSQELILAILLALIPCYSILTYNRNFVWKDEFTLWNDAVNSSPNKARPHMGKGDYYLQIGNYDKAIDEYTKAIEINDKSAIVYSNRGLAYQEKKEYEKALLNFEKALMLNSTLEKVYYNRGNIYRDKEEFDKALFEYGQALKLNPDFVDSYIDRGITYGLMGKYDQALAEFNRALKIDKERAEIYNNRGIIYRQKKEYSLALSDYNSALKYKPDFAEAYNNRGFIYFLMEDYEKAISDYNEALRINPNLKEAYQNRDIAYRKMQKTGH